MNNTKTFYGRVAGFYNNLPCIFDELQTYRGNMNDLIMLLCEGVDRGRGKSDGGIQNTNTWQTTFLMTGEETASAHNSSGGALNRLIEIYVGGQIVEDGIKTCDVINENYGFAGKEFIDIVKKMSQEELNHIFQDKLEKIKALNKTAEKQAICMAIILVADEIVCKNIFTKDEPLQVNEIVDYLFDKDEIDNSKRAYEYFVDEIAANSNKFIDGEDSKVGGYTVGEFWGLISKSPGAEVSILTSRFREIMKKQNFNAKKVLNEWHKKGYIDKNSKGKFVTQIKRNNVTSNYYIIKLDERGN